MSANLPPGERWIPTPPRIPGRRFEPVDKCIYCDGTEGLTDEHIIPLGLNGPFILPRASCELCADVTKRIEDHLLRGVYLAARAVLGMPTRRKNQRPSSFLITAEREDGEEAISVPVSDHLAPLAFPVFKLPAYLDGRSDLSPQAAFVTQYTALLSRMPVKELGKKYGAKRFRVPVEFRLGYFGRLLAKIGLGFAVAWVGLDGLSEVYVRPAILGTSDDVFRWVGSAPDREFVAHNTLHGAQALERGDELMVRVALFSIYDCPEYFVVVGRLTDEGRRRLTEME